MLAASRVKADAPAADAPATNEPAPSAPAPNAHASNEQDEDYAEVVVRGTGWASPRGIGDVRVKREQLDAAPHAQTSEMLSAAPGFFVDHEDGEGVGNDVNLRGFDLEHGSGIEMKVGSIPINVPTHILGQGYADVNFVIPEVVRSVRVLQGPYDPRQGDAAIVGSAYFDLGVAERGYQLKSSYGSFGQARLVGVVAPKDGDEETFAAFALRSTDGFGRNRAAQSGSSMLQYAFDVGPRDRFRVLGTAYHARAALAGVVRTDDVNAGRIGYYDSYPYFAGHQEAGASRVVVGVDYDHFAQNGARFEFAPWFMWTDNQMQRNFAGALEASQSNPALSGLGDLFRTTNLESAVGVVSRYHSATKRIGNAVTLVIEPGVQLRAGRTHQTKSLLDPDDLTVWDRRIDARLRTLDAGAYFDLDARLYRRLRISGGVRADALVAAVEDRLAGTVSTPGVAVASPTRTAAGVTVGPRVTIEYEVARWLVPAVSYGEGFRSLDAGHLPDGASQPFSKVRSFEGGLRAQFLEDRYTATAVAFETHVGNELVFEAVSGGLNTQNASVRRGFVGSLVAKPVDWLLAAGALSINHATFATQIPGIAHRVPNVPPVVLRIDATARGKLATIDGTPLTGRIGAGYTYAAGRYLTDAIRAPSNSILNAAAAIRYDRVELGIDVYNLADTRYADDAQRYVSNWSFQPGQQPASVATHVAAAPPRTLLASISLYF